MIKDFMQCGQSLSDTLKASDNVRADGFHASRAAQFQRHELLLRLADFLK